MEEIIENLDSYLDYVVETWMKENELAIESGIKVEMAESFMSGLKSLFEEHNVQIDEETVDVVSALEEEAAKFIKDTGDAKTSVKDVKEAIQGAKDIIAEDVSDHADLRDEIKTWEEKNALLGTKATKTFEENGV
jgi:transcriptional accessory protein Tex/SPT6